MNRGPIFLAGVSGSGKTALRLALSSHPRIAISRRTYMWTRFYDRYGDLARSECFERCLKAMLAHEPIWALNPDPERIRREFWQGDPTYARLFALFHQHYAERLGRARWGDQLGFVERYADLIFTSYGDAKMIHMVRDPRDRREAPVADSRRRVGVVGAATSRWLYSASLAKRNQRRYPDRYKVVRCEALVLHFEETLRDVCNFLDEDFVPGMLTMEGAPRFGDDHRGEVGPEPDPEEVLSGLGRASGATSDREIAFIQTLAGRDMLSLGYDLAPTRLSLKERLRLYAVDWPTNLASALAWRASQASRLA